MKEKFRPTLMANYLLWPAANLINFAFVPPSQRILYCNVVYVRNCCMGLRC
jgi:protein Mpv17